MARYSTIKTQEAYDYLRQLSRMKLINTTQFREKKSILDRREAKIQERAAAKSEAILAKRQSETQKTERRNVMIKSIKKQLKSQNVEVSLKDIDTKIGLVKFFKGIVRLTKNKLWLQIGETRYCISDFTRDRILALITEKEFVVQGMDFDSDGEFLSTYLAKADVMMTIGFQEDTTTNKVYVGAFFKYTHKTSFDLKAYGIFKTGEIQDHTDCCLIKALKEGGLPQEKIDMAKLFVKNRLIPRCKLKQVCEKLSIQITLKMDDKKVSKIVYGNKEHPNFHIGLLDDHYFIVNKTEITRYSLEHYDEVKDVKDFNKIYKIQSNGSFNRSNDRFLDSFDVIKILLENKNLLKQMTMDDRIMASTQFYDSISQTISSLEYDVETNTKTITKTENENKNVFTNIVFDFETNPNGTHKPYLVRTYGKGVNDVFIGDDCGLQMLRSLKGNTRLIAHNATYDYRFLIEHLSQIEEMARGNRLISLNAKFYFKGGRHIKIQIKDSYHLITMPLRAFPKVFGLKSEKEVMPYSIYNEENIQKRFCSINEVLSTIDDEDKEQFLNNIKRWNLQDGDNYDIIEYSSRYCELDCVILWEGYNKFREWMKTCVDIDIDNVLTIASLAHKYFVNQGCYDEVKLLGGIPQSFIQGCVVGGRTMTSNNEKIIVNEVLNDFDAVSLYPSAMSRMPGFLKGCPKVIPDDCLSYDWLKTQDGYFVDVVIKSVGINRDFPLISAKNDDGIRMFSNDMVSKTIRVDKTTLEDLIEFQKIEFDVIRGYFFNDGFNTQVRDTINFLFNERLTKKKEKNPVEIVYKLIMNSSYGKSIMKPIDSESRFYDNEEDANIFICRQYNWISHYTKFGGKTKIQLHKPLIDHFNICQVGVSILSMSKRIMNEVMCLAEDNNIKLYYQDTDSIHIKDKDIKTLSDAFTEKYGRELIGKNMGQFHSDFDIKGCKDIISRRAVFLGKKSYIDELEGTNEKGEKVVDYHIRMKGIPNSCLINTAKKMGYANIFDMYLDLYKGKKIEVDLTNDGTKANFKFNKDYSCHTLSVFKRTMCF
jgi:hypothetical protein